MNNRRDYSHFFRFFCLFYLRWEGGGIFLCIPIYLFIYLLASNRSSWCASEQFKRQPFNPCIQIFQFSTWCQIFFYYLYIYIYIFYVATRYYFIHSHIQAGLAKNNWRDRNYRVYICRWDGNSDEFQLGGGRRVWSSIGRNKGPNHNSINDLKRIESTKNWSGRCSEIILAP